MHIKNLLLFLFIVSVVGVCTNSSAFAVGSYYRSVTPQDTATTPLARETSRRSIPVESVYNHQTTDFQSSYQRPAPTYTPSPPVHSEPPVEVKKKPVTAHSKASPPPTQPAPVVRESTTKVPYVPESTHYSSLDILPISEDEQVRRALAAFLDEGTDIARLPAAFRKGLEARDPESYFSDAQTKTLSADEQLAGCLVHLIAQGKTSSLRELFDNPNWKLWVYLAQKIGIKTTCLDVVRSLHGAKQVFLSSPHHGQLCGLAEGFINTALTKIFYGCWGISSEPTEPDVMRELKGIARNLGSGRNRSLYATVNQVVGSYDQYNPGTVAERLQEHFLVVAQEISDGSIAAHPLKQHFISLFGSRSFSADLIQRTLGSLYGGVTPLPHSPLSGLMLSILTDSQLRKNISKERDNPRLMTILTGYTNADLMKLYGVIGYAGFELKKEKQFLKTQAPSYLLSSLPSSTKLSFLLGRSPLDTQAIDSLSETNIRDVIRQSYPFQKILWTEAIDRTDIPTWLRLVLLKHNVGLARPEPSAKAVSIIQTRDQIQPGWQGVQNARLSNGLMVLITLYDEICQISKPCSEADFVIHKPFFDLCLTQAKSSDLNFEVKRDVFRWLRALKDPSCAASNIQTYQEDEVIPAIEQWSKGPLTTPQQDALEASSQAWFQHPIQYERFSYGEFENLRTLINVTTPYPANPSQDDIKRIYSVVHTLLGMNLLRVRQADGALEESGWSKLYKKMAIRFHPDKHNTKSWVKEAEDVFATLSGLNSYVTELCIKEAKIHKIRQRYKEKLDRERMGNP